MRKAIFLTGAFLFALAAARAGDVHVANYTFHVPDGWAASLAEQDASPDGSRNGAFRQTLVLAIGGGREPVTTATAGSVPTLMALADRGIKPLARISVIAMAEISADKTGPVAAMVDKSLREYVEANKYDRAEQKFISTDGQYTPLTINGASCERWHQADAHHPRYREVCSDPEFPNFTVMMSFEMQPDTTSDGPVREATGLAVLDSLRFDHLGYRVTAIPVKAPQMIAEGFGSLWVTHGGDDGMVARINPDTNAVVADIAVGKMPIGLAADANGVWVANFRGNTVQRIDPATNSVAATIRAAKQPETVAVGAGSVWVSLDDPGSVLRIDSAKGTTTLIPRIVQQAGGLAFADGSVYLTDTASDHLLRIDPATNSVAASIAGVPGMNYMLADGKSLWVGSILHKKPSVLRYNLASNSPPAVFTKNLCEHTSGLALWHGKLWVGNGSCNSLSAVDPATGESTFVPVGFAPVGLLSAHGALWVSVAGQSAVLRLDPD